MEQDDHRARRLLDDLLDQAERVLGALAQARRARRRAALSPSPARRPRPRSRERSPRARGAATIGATRLEAIPPLVRDQDPQMFGLAVAHSAPDSVTAYASSTCREARTPPVLPSACRVVRSSWSAPALGGQLFRLRHSAGVASTRGRRRTQPSGAAMSLARSIDRAASPLRRTTFSWRRRGGEDPQPDPSSSSLITLGIYQVFWWYYANREMADYGRARDERARGQPDEVDARALSRRLIVVPAIWTSSRRSSASRPPSG